MIRLQSLLMGLPLAILYLGCNDAGQWSGTSKIDPEEWGSLPYLRQAADSRLHDELARIEQEQATPAQLTKRDVAKADDLSKVFRRLFVDDELEEIEERSESLMPDWGLGFEPVKLERAARFRTAYRKEQLEVRAALARPECTFVIGYTSGFFAKLDFLDAVRVYGRLEAITAAEHLTDDKPDDALEPLRYLLRAARCLGEERHAVTRMEAAFLRTDALAVVEAIVQHRAASVDLYSQLFELLDVELIAWPSDSEAWIGDRAIGLHTYEVVRAGEVRLLFSIEELDELSAEGALADLQAADPRALDADELYYLETMGEIIRHAREPFYRRKEFFDAWRTAMLRMRNQDDYPLVAARILLGDIEEAQEIQARDRAAVEAWALALASASKRPRPPYQVNPFSGEPYRVVVTENHVAVWGIGSGKEGDDRPAIVPLRGGIGG